MQSPYAVKVAVHTTVSICLDNTHSYMLIQCDAVSMHDTITQETCSCVQAHHVSTFDVFHKRSHAQGRNQTCVLHPVHVSGDAWCPCRQLSALPPKVNTMSINATMATLKPSLCTASWCAPFTSIISSFRVAMTTAVIMPTVPMMEIRATSPMSCSCDSGSMMTDTTPTEAHSSGRRSAAGSVLLSDGI